MLCGTLGLAVGCVAEQHGWRCFAAVAPLVADIGPQPAGPGASRAGRKHRHGRVIRVERGASHDVALERVHERVKELGRAPDPVGERGTGEIDASPGVDARLAVERQMVGVLGHEHMREHPAPGRPRSIGMDGSGA